MVLHPRKKFKQAESFGKLMAVVLGDSESVIIIDYLVKEKTINERYFASELTQLNQAVKLKRRGNPRAGAFLLLDNAPVHSVKLQWLQQPIVALNCYPIPYSPEQLSKQFSDFQPRTVLRHSVGIKRCAAKYHEL